MADEKGGESKQVVEELPGLVTLYSDGSVVRYEPSDPHSPIYSIPPSTAATAADFSSYDISINPTTNIWARIFFPPGVTSGEPAAPFPIVLHFHGGGFCVGSPSWRMYHTAIGQFCISSGAIWVSVAYRLAPESRLPAGFLDCQEAFDWLRQLRNLQQPDDSPAALLRRLGDFGRVFLAGDSAGGNFAYHVVLQSTREGTTHSQAFRVRGLLLLHPGFIREERSESERNGSERALVDIDSVEVGARMALPAGETKDYFLLNPAVPNAREAALPPSLVFIGGEDIFRDRQAEFCGKMAEEGQAVEVVRQEGMGHCFFLNEKFRSSAEAVDLLERVVAFIRCTET
ncbi:putative carboxylesterase 17 [Nymphaea thermarum]|nr:putative carboxylesterase 17 [Nymphaea thermarum]